MTFLNWDNSLDTGVKSMNDEHQVLIGFMNKLHELNEARSPKPAIQKALADLANYTIKHFKDEENYMASINYSGLGVHKIVHKNLLDKVVAFQEGFSKGKETSLGPDFFAFLKHWLISHIKGIDVKYGKPEQK